MREGHFLPPVGALFERGRALAIRGEFGALVCRNRASRIQDVDESFIESITQRTGRPGRPVSFMPAQ